MKNVKLIVMSCLLVLLAACGSKPAPSEDKNSGSPSEVKNDIPSEAAGVKAEMKMEEGKSEGQLMMKNSSDKEANTGTAYKIEKWNDGKWEVTNADQMFTEQMIIVKAGQEYEQAIDLKEKKAGTYRITKTFFEEEKKHEIAVVFEKK